MDTLRGDEDREINHHGTAIKVGEDAPGSDPVVAFSENALRHRDEKKELEARKEYYRQMDKKKKNEKQLKFCKKIGKQIIPTICILFAAVYWIYGFSQL